MVLSNLFEKVSNLLGKNQEEKSDDILVKEKVRCICTINKYLSQLCTLDFKKEYILFQYENGEMKVYYDNLISFGQIQNSEEGIKKAMDDKILSQSVLESTGFLAGNFYNLTNTAKTFLYLKFRMNDNNQVHTFLAQYDDGVEKAIKLLTEKKKIY